MSRTTPHTLPATTNAGAVFTSGQASTGLDRLRNLPRDARDTLFLLLVIAWVLWPQVPHLPVWCSALTAIVLAWRGYLAWNNRPLPGRWWLLGLLALAVGATWFTHRTLIGREAGVTLIIVLLALKTLELRAKRDAFVVFFLGFFTMLTNFLSSQSLLTAAAMLIGLMGLLTALVNAHMPVGKPPLRASAATAGRMVLLGAPIMAILFALFPRLAPLWGMPGENLNARTGLSTTMRVGAMASLALDESIALRVRFESAAPPPWQLYFRGPVLTYFDGIEWRPASPYQARVGAARAGLQTRGTGYRYQVTLEPHQRPWLMLLEASADGPDLTGYDVGMTADLQWLSTQPVTELLRYKAQSFPDYRYGPSSANAQPRYAIELPASYNPRTLQLASEMRSTPALAQADALTLSEAVLTRLRTGGYSYTLDPGVYGTHSADEFWFDRKEGFCEHIAAAYVVLMRALDVPARIVTGYQGGEQNALDGYWVVRQSDAHAWAEIWAAGIGWVRVDPTGAVAPNRVGSLTRLVAQPGIMAAALGTMSPNLAAKLRDAWDAVNNGWNQWVLNYGKSSQLNLLKNLGFQTPGWEDLGYLLSGLLVLASSLGAAWTLWERRQHDPWLRLLDQARARALASGITLPAHCSPRQISILLIAKYGDSVADTANWLLQLERQRYAHAQAPPTRASASSVTVSSPPQLAQLKRAWPTLFWPRAAP